MTNPIIPVNILFIRTRYLPVMSQLMVNDESGGAIQSSFLIVYLHSDFLLDTFPGRLQFAAKGITGFDIGRL